MSKKNIGATLALYPSPLIVLGWRRFILYLAFVMLFSLCTGLIVDLF